MATITDGTSNSIAVVQVDDENAVAWTQPDDWELDANDPLAGIGACTRLSFWPGSATATSRSSAHDIDPTVFKSLLTVDGGEVVQRGVLSVKIAEEWRPRWRCAFPSVRPRTFPCPAASRGVR